MNKDILDKLYEPFALKERKGHRGSMYTYIPNEDVIDRLNITFAGCWSTEVVNKEIIDDQVLVEVKVTVYDPETDERFYHTGFGSHPIARFTSGPNQGRIVDVGNVYKSATAKAIVNAGTRWGVGLFKASMGKVTSSTPVMPDIPTVPVNTPPVIPEPAPPSPQPVPVMPHPVPPSVPVPPTVSVPQPPEQVEAATTNAAIPVDVPVPPGQVVEATTTFPAPAVPEQPVSASVPLVQSPPEPAPEPVNVPMPPNVPKIPQPASVPSPPPDVPVPNNAPPVPDLPFSATQNLDGVGINNVQRVALNGILSLNNVSYEELAAEAFSSAGINKEVPNKEDLNYDEAVVIIKFGNDKYRKYKRGDN